MGIRFFKEMPQDIRANIGKYLSEKDKARVKGVSRAFHGKFKWNTNERWANWTYNTIMKTPNMLLDQAEDYEKNGNKILEYAFGISGYVIALPSFVVTKLATPIAFFAGSVKEKINSYITCADEQITFDKRFLINHKNGSQ